jgi:hypothetical protein
LRGCEWTRREPGDAADDVEPSAVDTVIAHPVYASAGRLAVVNPGPSTDAVVRDLLERAHGLARSRRERRASRDIRPAGEPSPQLPECLGLNPDFRE